MDKSMNISPITIMQFNNILNKIKENKSYIAQFNDVQIKFEGTYEDTFNGKREAFTITRKVEE